MRRAVLHVIASCSVAALAAACGDDSDRAASGSSASDGAALYAANCASCHGEDLEGTDLGPSPLSIIYEPGHHPDSSFHAAVRNGSAEHHWDFGPMPPVAGLSDAEIDAIVAFVRSEQERQGFRR